MSNPAPTLNQINAFNATQGTTIDFNIIGGTEVIRSNKIYIYDLSDNSLICTHLYVSTESIHELPPNTSSSIVYASGKSSADFTNNTQYYAQIQTFTDVGGTQGGSGLSIAKLFWCLPTPTLTLGTIPTTISTTSYNVSATYTPNTSGGATNEIQEFQFNLYSAIGTLLQTSGVVLYGDGVDLSYNFSGLEVDSTYYVTLDVTTTQGMNVSAQSNTFTVSIDTPTMGSASVVNNGCDGYISVTSNLSSEYEHEESAEVGEIMSFTTDSVNDITELDVDFSPVQDDTPWMSAQDTEPYTFRAIPSQTEDFGHESDTIVGGTIGWNQLVDGSGTSSASGSGVTLTKNGDGSFTLNGTADAHNAKSVIGNFIGIVGHKYLITGYKKVGNNTGYMGFAGTSTDKGSGGIFNYISTAYNTLRIDWFSGDVFDNLKIYPQCYDLTQMFGSTIADYIYTLETNNTGAGVAWFKKLFPKPYYAYNAGELMSVNAVSHDMVGFNAFDEVMELGGIDASTGVNEASTAILRSKNYIPVLPNTSYYFKCEGWGGNSNVKTRFYDADKNYIGYSQKSGTPVYKNSVFTTPDNCCFMRFVCPDSYGTTYKNDICINLSDPSLNGTYKPYTKHSYSLDNSITLRGIPKLDASNNLYYDGDVYESDGNVSRKYKEYIFKGNETWSQYAVGSDVWYTLQFTDGQYSNDALVVMEGFTSQVAGGGTTHSGNFDVWLQSTSTYKRFYVCVSSASSASDIQTATVGKKVVYPLATPTIETADPYTNPQIVDPHGTEQYVGSPIPVGHKTTYQRICPISGWDSVEVDVVGVNIRNVTDKTNIGWAYSNAEFLSMFNSLRAGTYTISFKNTLSNVTGTGEWRQGFYADGASPIDGRLPITTSPVSGQIYNYEKTFTITDSRVGKFTIVYLYGCGIGGVGEKGRGNFSNIQLEVGSTATPYTPYQGTTYTSTFPKYKQQVTQDKIPYITKNIGDTYADTLTENLVGGTIAWNQSVPDTTTTHTASGSIASMNDAVAGNFESVVCDINPVQDLNGYDSPWVGGGGKNKFDSLAGKANNVTFAKQDDGTVLITGTATSTSWTFLQEYYDLPYNGIVAGGNISAYTDKYMIVQFYNGNTQVGTALNPSNGVKYGTVPAEATKIRVIQYPESSQTTAGTVFNTVAHYYIGTDSNGAFTSWTPYANICPISGRDSVGVTDCGVNLFNEQMEIGKIDTTNGAELPSTNQLRSGFIKVLPSSKIYVSMPTTTMYLFFYDKDKNYISYTSQSGSNERTLANTVGYIRLMLAIGYGTNYNHDVSINYPSSYTNYIAYNGTTHTIPLGQTVYGGTVDCVSGVLKISEAKDTLTWGNYLAEYAPTGVPFKRRTFQLSNNAVSGSGHSFTNCIDTYNVGTPSTVPFYYVYDNYFYAWLPLDTASDFSIELCYELQTPQTIQLTPTQVHALLGQNNVWTDCGDTSVTYPTNHSYQSLSTTHKYYKRINGVESISVGSDVVADVGTDNIIDLTQMFGSTIADYIYNREQSSSSGMGVKFFKSLFPSDDYDYDSGTLISVNASAHVIKDANGNVLHTYPLDSDLVLRGIPKLDANNKLYYDGDVYEPDGSVTRKYGIVDLGSLSWAYNSSDAMFYASVIGMVMKSTDSYGVTNAPYIITQRNSMSDKSMVVNSGYVGGGNGAVLVKDSNYTTTAAFKASVSGKYLVYELNTPTTEQTDPFEENQAIIPNGIEEYVVTEQGDVEMPVGHDSTYYATEVYGGTIDMASGVLTINMVSVDLGSLNWTYSSSDGWFQVSHSGHRNTGALCSTYPCVYTLNNMPDKTVAVVSGYFVIKDSSYNGDVNALKQGVNGTQLVYKLATPIEISLTPQQMQTLSGQNNIWSNTNGGMYLVYQLPITSILVKRRDVADVSGKWLTLYSVPITQASDMDFTFIDFLNQYGKKYQYALVPVLAQNQSGVIVQIEGGYTVSDNVDSIFDGVYIADQTNVERVKAGVGYGNIDMNQGVGSITPIGSKYPIVITNSQNQYHNGSIRGTIVPNDFYSNGNLSRIDMVNKRDELEQFLTNKRAKIIKDWNGKMWLVMIMSNVNCSFDDNYGMGMVSFSADWLEVGDPTNQQDLYNAGLINVGGV